MRKKNINIKNIIYYAGMVTFSLLFISIVIHPSIKKAKTISIPLDAGGIESVEMIRYTEGGIEKELITTSESIEEIYKYWTKIKIGEESKTRCDDNTTIYKFLYKNGDMISLEKECNNYIQNGKSYEIIEP